MIIIAQYYLCANIAQIFLVQCLHGCLRPHRHKNWCGNITVVGVYNAGAGVGVFVLVCEFKKHDEG